MCYTNISYQLRYLPKVLGRNVPLRIADIVRLEADRNYTRFILVNGRYSISAKTLGYYENLLNGFVRVHRSHLLNSEHISRLGFYNNRLLMSDGKEVEIDILCIDFQLFISFCLKICKSRAYNKSII